MKNQSHLDRCKAFFEANGYIEFFDHRESGTWRHTTGPSWDEDVEYRVPPSPPIWQPISSAKKDGTVYLAHIRPDLVEYTGRADLYRWAGVQIPIKHMGLAEDGFDVGWSVAAPVGQGLGGDDWFSGVMPLPKPPEDKTND